MISPKVTDASKARRFGSSNDGGYILIDDIGFSDFLISMGVASDVNFEVELSKKIAGAHLYDDSINCLPRPIINSKFFKDRVGGEGFVSLEDALANTDHQGDFILKMDIEGSEWEALDFASSEVLHRFRQIVIEYHWFENIQHDDFFLRVQRVLDKLELTHFVLNAHPNNWGDILVVENLTVPSVVEVTYLRKRSFDFSVNKPSSISQVDALNEPCNPNYPELKLMNPMEPKNLILDSKNAGMFSRNMFYTLREEHATLREEHATLREEHATLREEHATLREEHRAITNSKIWRYSNFYRKVRG
jgi:hypothetical protein